MKRNCIFLFVFLIVFSFIMSSFCFATTDENFIELDGEQVDVSNVEFNSRWFVTYTKTAGSWFSPYYLYVLGDDCTIYKGEGNSTTIVSGEYTEYRCKENERVFKKISDYNNTSSVWGGSNVNCFKLSSFDILYEDGTLFFGKNVDSNVFELNLFCEPTEMTEKLPVTIYTQSFPIEKGSKYKVQWSIDGKVFSDCDIRSFTDQNTGKTTIEFYHEVYRNGSYHFKLIDRETSDEVYASFTITNINSIHDDGNNNYINGVFDPTPSIGYDFVSDNHIVLYTQRFYEKEIRQLECYYVKDLEGSVSNANWQDVNIRSFTDQFGTTSYQFYIDVFNDEDNSGNGTYHFKFYNKTLDKENFGSMTVDFSKVIEMQKQLDEGYVLMQKYLNFFKERFGILIYPFELFINIVTKIGSIKFEEPAFVIPDIYEPFTNVKLVSETNFNFNDLLENDILKNVHDIYLIVVDVIIVFALVNLAKNKIMGVFEK